LRPATEGDCGSNAEIKLPEPFQKAELEMTFPGSDLVFEQFMVVPVPVESHDPLITGESECEDDHPHVVFGEVEELTEVLEVQTASKKSTLFRDFVGAASTSLKSRRRSVETQKGRRSWKDFGVSITSSFRTSRRKKSGTVTGSDSQSQAERFVGVWSLQRIEGDMEAFMVDCGTGWAMRKLASKMNYGIGQSVQDVELDGASLTIVNKIGPKVARTVLSLSGEEAVSDGLDGRKCMSSVSWEGETMCITNRTLSGEALPGSRRYFAGSECVIEATSPAGKVVRRYYMQVS
jgi:hypothetical protein